MKGEILYKILDVLEDGVMGTSDFIDAILTAGYGASFGKIEKINKKLEIKRHNYQISREKHRHLQIYISKLKNDGYICENRLGKVSLSNKGKNKLDSLKKKGKYSYKKEISDKVIIISYDIPIAFNKERDTLREILKILGFDLIHKSVWIGKVKLPENFIRDLEKMGILKFIEIIEIANKGTLKYKK